MQSLSGLSGHVVPAGFATLCLMLGLAFAGCSSLAPEAEQEKRIELDAMSETVLARLVEKRPEAREVIEQSVGYAVADMSLTKVPVVGGGKGYGVVVDKRSNERAYVEVSQFEVGGGLGAQKFKAVVLFKDAALLERAMTGFWHFGAGAEAGAGDASMEGSVSSKKGYQAYKIAEGGVVATLTVRAIRARPL